MQITERDAGVYAVQWRVPKALPPRAVPVPEFPEICGLSSEPTVASLPGAWLLEAEWRCEANLAGRAVGMSYPFPDLALTTVVRVDLLSGDRFAHVLSPGEGQWQLPEGTASPDVLVGARRAVLVGAAHALGSWVHLAFLIVLVLLGGFRQPMRLILALTVGQAAGVVVAGFADSLDANLADLGLAVGAVVLARQTLEPEEERRRLWASAAVAGFVHGLGLAALLAGALGDEYSSLAGQLLAVLGMDAAHLVGGLLLAAAWALISNRPTVGRIRRATAYVTGAAAVALAVALALVGVGAETGAIASSLIVPTDSPAGPTGGLAASQRIAPTTPDAPIQSFIAVEPFEVRHEAMLRLGGLAEVLGLEMDSTLEVDEQPSIVERLGKFVVEGSAVQVDGETREPLIRRADFMKVDPTGALPRPNSVPEPVGEAVVGVVVAYPTTGVPRRVSFAWRRFPSAFEYVPTTVIDPENVVSRTLTAEEPSLIWQNTLREDPIPTVEAVEVEPVHVRLPWLSLPLMALSGVLLVRGIRGRHRPLAFALARVVLALAFVVGPLVQSALALPGSAGRTPSERQARRILAGLLPNIYRAFEFRDEATIYDRLAVSVTGETLTQVYLEHRRALEVEERGGAQARVEAVEVLQATELRSRGEGFGVRCEWTVGGMVTHFGHRHFRQNRYDARIEVVPVADTWRIRSIEVLELERIR
jgi:hypothetical protein